MHLVQKVKNLIVICSYLSISTNTINNLVDFILKYPALLCDATSEVYLFLSSILNESQKYNSKLKRLLNSWLKDNFENFIEAYQSEQKKILLSKFHLLYLFVY